MRRMTVLFGLAFLATACLADASSAQQSSRPATGQSGAASRPPALRGAINPQPARPAQSQAVRGDAPPSEPSPLPPMPSSLSPDGGQCRLECAQSYYFCLGGDSSDECSSAWGRCRAGCTTPRAPAPVWVSPAPMRLPTP